MNKINARFLAPFGLADLSPLPSKSVCNNSGPAFVGVGTPKSGTSWVSRIIFSHPDVVENRLGQKELHYFSHFSYKTMDQSDIGIYRAAFICQEGKITGEFTPSYYWYPFALKHLHDAVPEAKIIMVMRNPIDRMMSHLNQIVSVRSRMLGLEGDSLNVYRFTSIIPEIISASFYGGPLDQIFEYFDKDKVLVLQYEKLVEDIEGQVKNIYKFLALEEYQPSNVVEVVNSQPYIVGQRLSEDERRNLALYFIDDVAAVAKRRLIDMNLWRDFRCLL
jgi:hypothetical protein